MTCDINVSCQVDDQLLSMSFVMLCDMTFCLSICLSALSDLKIFPQTNLSCAQNVHPPTQHPHPASSPTIDSFFLD